MNAQQTHTGRDAREAVSREAHHLAEVAGEKFKEYKASAKELMHDVNNTTLADVERKAGIYIREHPANTLLTAAAIGFALAFLFFRR